MKLSDLRGSIRKATGNPKMIVDLGNGVPLTVTFQKTPLLEELGRVFNGERTAETGLSFDPETGMILVEGVIRTPNAETVAAMEAADQGDVERVDSIGDLFDDSDDEDDLL